MCSVLLNTMIRGDFYIFFISNLISGLFLHSNREEMGFLVLFLFLYLKKIIKEYEMKKKKEKRKKRIESTSL